MWNDDAALHRELRNPKPAVVFSGLAGCGEADPVEQCAGSGAEGLFFLSIERQPTRDRGQFEEEPTCGSCHCCRLCRDPTARAQNGAGLWDGGCLDYTFDDVAPCRPDEPGCTRDQCMPDRGGCAAAWRRRSPRG